MARAADYFESGAFLADLRRRVAFRTESGVAEHREDLHAYLEQEMIPAARRLGATAACWTTRWYGRGTADNKGQHPINLAALEQVLRARGGRLGFNLKILIETGEESGSPGLGEFCAQHAAELAADVLIASDGPRVAAQRPTVFLGSRGSAGFTLRVPLRDRAHHSGNWGGLLRNPATVLACAGPAWSTGEAGSSCRACARRRCRTASARR